jgi:hypothetical protein
MRGLRPATGTGLLPGPRPSTGLTGRASPDLIPIPPHGQIPSDCSLGRPGRRTAMSLHHDLRAISPLPGNLPDAGTITMSRAVPATLLAAITEGNGAVRMTADGPWTGVGPMIAVGQPNGAGRKRGAGLPTVAGSTTRVRAALGISRPVGSRPATGWTPAAAGTPTTAETRSRLPAVARDRPTGQTRTGITGRTRSARRRRAARGRTATTG